MRGSDSSNWGGVVAVKKGLNLAGIFEYTYRLLARGRSPGHSRQSNQVKNTCSLISVATHVGVYFIYIRSGFVIDDCYFRALWKGRRGWKSERKGEWE